jgi:hypothetical protein
MTSNAPDAVASAILAAAARLVPGHAGPMARNEPVRRHTCDDTARCGYCIAEIAWRQSQPYNSPAWQGRHPLNPKPTEEPQV